ncbi:unnamed protein product [Linum tenue]|uniref:Uncharacterized protein n=1 Tax=Linum tenue TaxID=586396 RepID=A0AAV0GVP8_9ROSI|nr:unnamed protein product [Linum tenue]CAI0376717.1 unnamed protein product [Linum tenue]
MLALKALSTSRLGNRWLIPVGVFPISPFSELAGRSTSSSSTCLVDCLITKFEFPETKALSIAARFPRLKSSQKPQALFEFLRGLGFSLDCIQSTVSGAPQILFANVDKNLKPKIELFQKLGFESPRLVKFLSKNGAVLTASLEKKLRPRVHILLETFHQKDVLKAIEKCSWLAFMCPHSRLLSNVALLQSCGIVGSQLSMLLKMQPRLFIRTDCKVRDIVSRTLDLGFSVESRMFIYGMCAVSAFSVATLDRKFAVFEGFGFSRSECIAMFRRSPTMLGRCDEKLSSGLDFFLNTVNLTKEMVVRSPALLMYSMEGRVIPRYRVLKTMESKFLFKKKPSFRSVMSLTNERFVEKFVFMYPEHAEELLIVYNGRNVDSSADAAYS